MEQHPVSDLVFLCSKGAETYATQDKTPHTFPIAKRKVALFDECTGAFSFVVLSLPFLFPLFCASAALRSQKVHDKPKKTNVVR